MGSSPRSSPFRRNLPDRSILCPTNRNFAGMEHPVKGTSSSKYISLATPSVCTKRHRSSDGCFKNKWNDTQQTTTNNVAHIWVKPSDILKYFMFHCSAGASRCITKTTCATCYENLRRGSRVATGNENNVTRNATFSIVDTSTCFSPNKNL